MPTDELRQRSNPDADLSDPVDLFDAVTELVSPGIKAPVRPVEIDLAPTVQSQPEIEALVARIESALEVIHAALAEIKRIQSPQLL
jgi:hypothetical protein